MRDLCRLSFVLGVLGLSHAAFAQCTRDTDCKGERVCDQGVCVDPSQRSGEAEAPPPPPREEARRPPRRAPAAEPSEGWTHADRPNVLAVDPLATLGGFIVGAANQYTLFTVLAEYERALTPLIGLYGQVAPVFASTALGAGFGLGVLGGIRFHFMQNAPEGFYASGALGFSGGLALVFGAGYTWMFDSGLTFGLGATLNPIGLASGLLAVGLNAPIGFSF